MAWLKGSLFLEGCMCLFSAPLLLLLSLVLLPGLVGGFVPLMCLHNATLSEGVCCPIPPGFSEPCGGPGRGSCVYIEPSDEQFSPVYPALQDDDRLDWPRRFFKYQCQCEGNFMGYMCHECYWGYRGTDCQEKHKLIRKNALSLTPAERKQFRDALNKSKTEPSEWVVPIDYLGYDPIRRPVFRGVSVNDYISFVHAYSARHTVAKDYLCYTRWRYDFSHGGSSFPTWHRLLILRWEREIQRIAQNDSLTFPYWDFIGRGDVCEVCNNDFVGATNRSGSFYFLDPESPFHNWMNLCQYPSDHDGCFFCDPVSPGGTLWRRMRTSQRLPTLEEKEWAEAQISYDSYPFNTRAPHGFRNAMEGFLSIRGIATTANDLDYTMHNSAHEFFRGPISFTAISSDDPLFTMLHSYVDKLLELWMRRHNPNLRQLPVSGAPAGHNWNASLVPFFPRELSHHYFKNSLNFGYDYDDIVNGYQWYNEPEEPTTSASGGTYIFSTSAWLAGLVLLIFCSERT